MKSKLQRAVDATLEKYQIKLDCVLGYNVKEEPSCGLCLEYRHGSQCGTCPVYAIEPADWPWFNCIAILRVLDNMDCGDHAVPAILAAMIYLHGFVEE